MKKDKTSLMAGIISILCFPLSFFGLAFFGILAGFICGIIGIIFGYIHRDKSNIFRNNPGFLLSIIGLLLNAVFLFFFFRAVIMMGGYLS